MDNHQTIDISMELGVPKTPDTKAKEEDCRRHRLPFFIRAQRGLLPLLLSESDTTPKYEEPRVAHHGDRSSSPTVVEPSDVSSMTSTSQHTTANKVLKPKVPLVLEMSIAIFKFDAILNKE
eukprot:scaffold10729_cov91-Skeletonema_dohrnii-CCMP3373.AAC.4